MSGSVPGPQAVPDSEDPAVLCQASDFLFPSLLIFRVLLPYRFRGNFSFVPQSFQRIYFFFQTAVQSLLPYSPVFYILSAVFWFSL